MLISADRVVFPEGIGPGWVEVSGERIVAVGTGPAPDGAQVQTGWISPGLVDIHCHGGGGASFVTEDPEVARTALAAHRARGVTSMVASLVTGTLPDLTAQVLALKGLVASGELAGIHLEGPWLAARYKGAHPEPLLRDPVSAEVEALLDAGEGSIRMVTIAPERPAAMAAIALMAERGVVAAIGHTDADFDTVRRAIDAGATGATHLFNAMAPLKHREPGPVLALWSDPRVTVEVILDGVHVHPELVAFVMASARGRAVLVTDAMAAAAAADGDYLLGELPVEVRDQVARIAGTDTIAGSTLTLDGAVRNAVASGMDLHQAVAAATWIPADHLGLAEVGRLQPGCLADLVVFDEAVRARRVLYRGAWL